MYFIIWSILVVSVYATGDVVQVDPDAAVVTGANATDAQPVAVVATANPVSAKPGAVATGAIHDQPAATETPDPCEDCPEPCKKPVEISYNYPASGLKEPEELTGENLENGGIKIKTASGKGFCVGSYGIIGECEVFGIDSDGNVVPRHLIRFQKLAELHVICEGEAMWTFTICISETVPSIPGNPGTGENPLTGEECEECPEPCKKLVTVEYKPKKGRVTSPKGLRAKEEAKGILNIKSTKKLGGFCVVSWTHRGRDCDIVGVDGDGKILEKKELRFKKLVEFQIRCESLKNKKKWIVQVCVKDTDPNVGGNSDEPPKTTLPSGTKTEIHLDASRRTGEGRNKRGRCKGCPEDCEKVRTAKNLTEELQLNGKTYKKGRKIPISIIVTEGDPCIFIQLASGQPFCLKTLYLKVAQNQQNPSITATLQNGTVESGDPSGMKMTKLSINCDGKSKILEWLIVICVDENSKK